MKATLPVYLAIARQRWVGTQAWRTAARPADTAKLALDATSALAHSPPQCAALTISAAFAARLLLATCAGCGRLFS